MARYVGCDRCSTIVPTKSAQCIEVVLAEQAERERAVAPTTKALEFITPHPFDLCSECAVDLRAFFHNVNVSRRDHR